MKYIIPEKMSTFHYDILRYFLTLPDTSGDNSSSGIILPNGRGQPRSKMRHVTDQDIQSLERAHAVARKKLKTILDKATEDAK